MVHLVLVIIVIVLIFCLIITVCKNKSSKIPQVEISFDRQKILGTGTYGSVYQGEYSRDKVKKPVAVKRVQLVDVERENKGEDTVLKLKLDHPNVIKLFGFKDDKDYRNYALELCVSSLDRLYLKDGDPKKYSGPIPSVEDMLLQLARGLEYIHSKKLVHRDIKPSNILISECRHSDNSSSGKN